MFHNKPNFTATLADQPHFFHWRKAQAKRFTHDARNAEAAQRLLELALEIVIPADVWQQLAPLIADPGCLSGISETNRDVAFRRHPANFSAWLEDLLSNLTHQ